MDDKIQIAYPVKIELGLSANEKTKSGLSADQDLRLEGYVTVESDAAVDPAAITNDTPVPQWKIQSLNWVRTSMVDLKPKRL